MSTKWLVKDCSWQQLETIQMKITTNCIYHKLWYVHTTGYLVNNKKEKKLLDVSQKHVERKKSIYSVCEGPEQAELVCGERTGLSLGEGRSWTLWSNGNVLYLERDVDNMGKHVSLKLRYLLSQKTKIRLFPSDTRKYSVSSGEKNTPIRSQET